MKQFIKEFCKRGLMFAWGGPFITAIVWFSIHAAGKLETLTVTEAVIGIITTTVLAFIAAGISVIHQTENVPKAFAALIQAAVLYVDYLGFYLLNGWIPLERVWIFTVIFVAVFAIILGLMNNDSRMFFLISAVLSLPFVMIDFMLWSVFIC